MANISGKLKLLVYKVFQRTELYLIWELSNTLEEIYLVYWILIFLTLKFGISVNIEFFKVFTFPDSFHTKFFPDIFEARC